MPDSQLTWGEIKEFMEAYGVPDIANIFIEVELKGTKPPLIVSGWANGIAKHGTYSVNLRCSA